MFRFDKPPENLIISLFTHMEALAMKTTYFAKKEEFTQKRWRVVDADGQTLGRLAVQVANALRGKDKPTFTPHVDTGDCVVVVNAAKIKMTGKKLENKIYYHHTGYIGHLKSTTAGRMMKKRPEKVLEKAVYGMLPGNKLRKIFMGKLKIYAGPEHPHAAQKPETMEIS
jgi:large subunit ribosomal protein L13